MTKRERERIKKYNEQNIRKTDRWKMKAVEDDKERERVRMSKETLESEKK